MLPEPSLQTRFTQALFEDGPPPAGLFVREGADLSKRFAIYRNNVRSSLAQALRARFPVLEAMLGEEFFGALAQVFIEQHPPRSPVLALYGSQLPEFLERFAPVRDWPYLPDLARLEEARASASYAQDAAPLSGEALAALAPEEYETLTFTPHPAAQILHSPYPVVSLWQAHQSGAGTQFEGEETALITRPAYTVQVVKLEGGSADFVSALFAGKTLGEASTRIDPTHLGSVLAMLLQNGAFTSLSRMGEGQG